MNEQAVFMKKVALEAGDLIFNRIASLDVPDLEKISMTLTILVMMSEAANESVKDIMKQL